MMRIYLKKNIIYLILFFQPVFIRAQEVNADSILRLIRSDKADTNKVVHLNDLAWELSNNNPDTALILAEEAKSLSEELGWKAGIGSSCHKIGWILYLKGEYSGAVKANELSLRIWEEIIRSEDNQLKKRAVRSRNAVLSNLGIAYYAQGDYTKALDYYHKALAGQELAGDRKKTGGSLGNIGVIYKNQGNYSKALEYYFRSLKIDEEFGNKYGMCARLSNIGVVYSDMGNNDKALEYYKRSLELARQINNRNSMAGSVGNIGTVFQSKAREFLSKGDTLNFRKALDEALEYFEQYYSIAEELNNKNYLSISLINIASVHESLGNLELALKKNLEALRIAEESGDKKNIALSMGALGSISMQRKEYKKAEHYFLEAVGVADSVGILEEKMKYELELSELYELTGEFGKSLLHYRSYAAAKDSLFSEEKEKELTRHELNYEFDKRSAAFKAEEEKKEAVAQTEKKRQKILFLMLTAVAFAAGLIAILVFRSLRLTKKQKKIIESQKSLVEEKQKEVLDSIHYAKRIQTSLITSENYISRHWERLRKEDQNNNNESA
ncbi:MAG TPA: tetratricopeptide repeat protein [Bacteroidia bacterium]|jgi:tetratricopeptide (TPR) repeat protein